MWVLWTDINWNIMTNCKQEMQFLLQVKYGHLLGMTLKQEMIHEYDGYCMRVHTHVCTQPVHFISSTDEKCILTSFRANHNSWSMHIPRIKLRLIKAERWPSCLWWITKAADSVVHPSTPSPECTAPGSALGVILRESSHNHRMTPRWCTHSILHNVTILVSLAKSCGEQKSAGLGGRGPPDWQQQRRWRERLGSAYE